MRIIAGTTKGRRLFSPPSGRGGKGEIRPTADRAREALFNVLAGRVDGARVLDLCAGTGAFGLEALSRGAELSVFVDNGKTAITLISKNIHACGFEEESTVLKRDLSKGLFFLQSYCPEGFTLVFADPPYKNKFLPRIIAELGKGDMIRSEGLLIVEASAKDKFPDDISALSLIDQRSYGEAGFWIYIKK